MRQSPTPTTEPSQPSPTDRESDPGAVSANIADLLPRLHVLVVGPGLGRDPAMHAAAARVLRTAREKGLPLVLDADALLIVQKDPELVSGYEAAVLTPNVVEFSRLCKAVDLDVDPGEGGSRAVEALAKRLGGVTIVQKGKQDLVSNGEVTLAVDVEGGRKRSGGQGDTLTGSVATFLAWRKAYLDGLWDVGEEKLDGKEMVGLAAFAGCAITKVSFLTILSRFRCLASLPHPPSVTPSSSSLNLAVHALYCARSLLTATGMLPAGLQEEGPEPTGKRPHRRGPPRLHDPLRRGGRGRRVQAVNRDITGS